MSMMTRKDDGERFADLKYEDFQRLAQQPGLSPHQRIGFPDSYRAGFEDAIFDDIAGKLPMLANVVDRPGTIVDIGPGCGPLAEKVVAACSDQGHHLVLVDSPEMLAHSPSHGLIRKIEGRFPQNIEALRQALPDGADAILLYSVLHYIFPGTGLAQFQAATASLLRPGGAMLIGDIPNVSKRRRFFSSESGRRFHRAYTGRDEDPDETMTMPGAEQDEGLITDAVVLQLIDGFRGQGLDAYIVPQASNLPMANRREDILVKRP
jgi:hypothetical protein